MGSLAALARLPSNLTRHGEQTCASAYFVPLITRHGELGASKCAYLPIFSDTTRLCELGASNCASLPIFGLVVFVSCFPSLLSALSNFPAKLGKVR